MTPGRIALFITVLTTLIGLFSAYMGWRLIPSSWPAWGRGAAWAAVAVVVLLQPLAFALRFAGRDSEALAWIAYLAMGVFALLLTATVLRDVGWLGARVTGLLPTDPSRREAIFQMTNAAVLAVAGAGFAVGVVRARAKPTVVEVTVPIVGLPAALEGFTIAQISDIHIGPTIHGDFMQSVVDVVNGLRADLVAVTGDLVDGSVAELSRHTAPLAQLKATHGAWFVTGNHEYYSGADAWLDEVRRLGLTTLVNEHRVVVHGGENVVVAGVTDISSNDGSSPHKAIEGAPAGFRLLLAHQPRSAYDAEKAGFQLQLSGHTHGGQFFPGTLLVRLAQPFVEGLNQLNNMWVYTNRGTGYWGPPMRHTSVASEVTRLTLARA